MKIKTIFSKTVILFFCLTFVAIFVGQTIGITSKNDPIEKRIIAPFPKLSLKNKNLISELNSYFSDNFGFRNILLKTYLFVKINIFKSKSFSRSANSIDWRDFNKSNINPLYNPPAYALYTPDQLSSWKNFLEREQRHLETQDIPYFLVIIPDQKILNKNLPDSTRQFYVLKHYQFVDYMRKNSSIKIVDTTDALLKASAENQLPILYKTDSHWTNYGAYIAYLEVIKEMGKYNKTIKPYQKDDFNIQLEKYDFWLGDGGYNYSAYPYRPDYGVKFTAKDSSKDKYRKAGAVLIYGDSFLDIRRRVCLPCLKEEFPSIEPIIPLLFVKPPIYKDEWDFNPDYWYAKDRLENLIPIIRQNIKDKSTQDRFINYLQLLGLLPDRVGLNYFLRLNFNDVVYRYTVSKLEQSLIDKYKPMFVVREALDERIPHLFNRLDCLYKLDKRFFMDNIQRCVEYN